MRFLRLPSLTVQCVIEGGWAAACLYVKRTEGAKATLLSSLQGMRPHLRALSNRARATSAGSHLSSLARMPEVKHSERASIHCFGGYNIHISGAIQLFHYCIQATI